MDVNVEIEAKIRVAQFTRFRSMLPALGAERASHVHERNLIFDRSGGELRKRGERLRLRIVRDLEESEASPVLTFKGKRVDDDALKQRPEVEVGVTDSESAVQLLCAMGFDCIFSYEKQRESWVLGRCRVELDHLPLLGRFIEVEGSDPDHVRETIDALGLADRPTINRGYVGMLRRHLRQEGLDRRHVSFDAPAAGDLLGV